MTDRNSKALAGQHGVSGTGVARDAARLGSAYAAVTDDGAVLGVGKGVLAAFETGKRSLP